MEDRVVTHTLDAHSLVAAAILTAAVIIVRAIRAAVKGQTSAQIGDEVTNIVQLFLAVLTELQTQIRTLQSNPGDEAEELIARVDLVPAHTITRAYFTRAPLRRRGFSFRPDGVSLIAARLAHFRVSRSSA
jgi:hypothetical protein